jgi:hypothetical protein
VHIIPYLSAIAVHPEALVRLALIEQLGPLACFCCNTGGDEGYLVVVNRILPVIQFSLADANADIRLTACSAFLTVSQLMHAADLESRILSAILVSIVVHNILAHKAPVAEL